MINLKELLFNRPLFISLLSIFTLVVISLLVYCSVFIPQTPKVEEMVMYPLNRPIVTFPFEINVVDGDFNITQQKVLESVANSWKTKTKDLIDIKFNFNWKAPLPFSESNYIQYGQKTIWLRDSSDPEILRLQLKTSLNADGISKGDFIIIMNDFDSVKQDNNKLFTIVMHELGHQIGLEHIRSQYPALMNINGNDGIITDNDLLVLCFRYNCKK